MSTEIKTITGKSDNNDASEIYITIFWGGQKKGAMIQLTIRSGVGLSYIQLTQMQVDELAKTLKDSFNYESYPSE